MTAKPLPPYEELIKRFTYDPDSGVLTHEERLTIRDRKRNGVEVGYLTSNGYLRVKINGLHYRVARLIWKMYYKEDPPEGTEIDHINRIRTDNRIINLRAVTHIENLENRRPYIGLPDKSRPIVLISPDGVEIQYPSMTSAAENNNLIRSEISSVCRGRQKTTKGYTARYV